MTPVRVLRILGCRGCPHAVFLPAAHLATGSVATAWFCSLQGAQIAQADLAPAVAPASCPLRESPVLHVLLNRDQSRLITGPGFQVDPDKAGGK